MFKTAGGLINKGLFNNENYVEQNDFYERFSQNE